MRIEDIVGKKTWARLKKAGLDTPQKLANLTPEKMMAIAGIGPKTAKMLYKAFGKNVSERNLNRSYKTLKARTKFNKIGMKVRQTLEDPTNIIARIEDRRKEAILWRNFLARVYNFGKEETDKLSVQDYIPINTTLDYRDINYQRVLRDYTMEAKLKVSGDQVFLDYTRYDMSLNRQDWNLSESFIGSIGRENVRRDILENLNDQITKFREITKDGYFIIILDQGMGDLEEAIRNRYRKDIDKETLMILRSEKSYYEWEIIFRFIENKTFKSFLERADAFRTFFDYKKYLGTDRKNKMSFEEFKDQTKRDFIVDTAKDQIAHLVVNNAPKITFGIIQSIDSLYRFNTQGYTQDKNTYFTIDRIETWEQFKDILKEQPTNYETRTIPAQALAFIKYVFRDDYTIHNKGAAFPIIFTSNVFPELGVVIQ